MNEKQSKEAYAFVSKLILNVLCNETFDKELLFTFSIYLQFGIIRAEKETISSALEYSKQLLEKIITSSNDAEEFDTVLSYNKEMMTEICGDVWSVRYTNDLIWMYDWRDFCQKMNQNRNDDYSINMHLLNIVRDNLEIGNNHNIVPFSYTNDILHNFSLIKWAIKSPIV